VGFWASPHLAHPGRAVVVMILADVLIRWYPGY
jgi:hypothetical protein